MKLIRAVHLYLESLKAENFAPRTIDTQAPHLTIFIAWAEKQSVEDIGEVDLPLLRAHYADLMTSVTRYNRPPSIHLQIQRICTLRSFFRFLVRRQWLLIDPSRDLEVPRDNRRTLPYGLPTPAEMIRILSAPDTDTLMGVRDRAILEVLYSSGLRNAELRALRAWDVDLENGIVTVIRGKGQKDRVLPLGKKAREWVERYLEEVRPQWVRKSSTGALFVTSAGNPLHFTALIKIVKVAVAKAGIKKRVTVHTLRHACATHMLSGGADVRYLQQLLGHRSLQSTMIYTQVAIQDLQRVHRRCHPRAGARARPSMARKGRRS